MTDMPAFLLADGFVSLTSLIGLIIFAGVLRRREPQTELIRKFIFAIQVLIALMAARLLQWSVGWEFAGRLTFLAAGLVPLAAVLVVEALLRRHAPLILKIWVVVGAFAAAGIAIFTPAGFGSTALVSLAVFQTVTFLALVGLVFLRDQTSLATSENDMINRLALSLLLILPFALTDFRTEFLDLPVRLSGVAILVLIWLALTLDREKGERNLLRPTLAYGITLLAAAFAIAGVAGLDTRTTVQVIAMMISAALLAATYDQARRMRQDKASDRLISFLGRGAFDDHKSYLLALQDNAPAGGFVILNNESLSDFDDAFRESLKAHHVVAQSDVANLTDASVAEQFDWFFQKYEASHAMLVSLDPIKVAALNVPVLAQSDRLEDELRVAQRMAVAFAARETQHG